MSVNIYIKTKAGKWGPFDTNRIVALCTDSELTILGPEQPVKEKGVIIGYNFPCTLTKPALDYACEANEKAVREKSEEVLNGVGQYNLEGNIVETSKNLSQNLIHKKGHVTIENKY